MIRFIYQNFMTKKFSFFKLFILLTKSNLPSNFMKKIKVNYLMSPKKSFISNLQLAK